MNINKQNKQGLYTTVASLLTVLLKVFSKKTPTYLLKMVREMPLLAPSSGKSSLLVAIANTGCSIINHQTAAVKLMLACTLYR